jgi:hypothetical protein
MCQLSEISCFTEDNSYFSEMWQICRRIIRFIRNRIYLVHYILASLVIKKKQDKNLDSIMLHLKPGDRIKVKSKSEIKKTLNGWKQFEGCRFIDEMMQYCGTKGKVLKTVHHILDEREMKIKKCKNVVILEGVVCNGAWPFRECDRSCYFLWKEAWLTKIE